jgi:pimeloyl-ACP methyl ester carboxylesterase
MANVAKSRGYTISYEDVGQGRPVVLIPGFMQTNKDWRDYVGRLADIRRVLAMDPLGQGKSDKPHDSELYRSPGVAADVIAVLDAAGVEKATLWGYSRGMWLGAMTAIEYPDRMAALILGGGSLTDPPPTEMPPWVEPISRGDWEGFFSLFGIPLDAKTKAHFQAHNDPKAMAAERTGRIESAYTFDLTRVSVPALVYCGADDGPEDADATAEALHTKVHVVPGDHANAFSAVDEVMAAVLPFLESVQDKKR